MLDEWKDTLFEELTDIGNDFIRNNTKKVIEVVTNIVKEVIATNKKTNDKFEIELRNSINKAVAEGCEIGYQAGRMQKMQLLTYGMSRTGLNNKQIRQVFDVLKDAEEEFDETYNTYEKYTEMMQNIAKHI